MHRRLILSLAAVLAVGACNDQQEPTTGPESSAPEFASSTSVAGINVVFKRPATAAQLAQLGKYGKVKKQFPEVKGLTMAGKASDLPAIRALGFVKAAAVDAAIDIPPNTDLVSATDLMNGFSTWDQDATNVTISPLSAARGVSKTGNGVFVGILDTGLLNTWPQYFPRERVATQYATSFVGGGEQDKGNVTQPGSDQWQHDVCAHGTHVASTILGYQFGTLSFQGTAPKATIIPVQLHSQGSANSNNDCGFNNSVAAAGLLYFAQLKQGPLASSPLVVNNSWGSRVRDPLVEAAVNFALSKGVLLVFSAGNAGDAGMGYPGGLPQVISAGASGWIGEWKPCTLGGTPVPAGSWFFGCNVPEPTSPSDFYITDFSSREKSGQDLDVAAPGSWVVGPFQLQRGKPSLFFLGGTSMAAPHVTGTVALMLQKNHGLTESQAESIIEGSAVAIGAGCRSVLPGPGAPAEQMCWGADATGSGLLNTAAAVAATP